MIVIQIRLATVSILSLCSALLSASVASLGFVLGAHGYHGIKHMQIPCYLTGAGAIALTISQIFSIPWAYNPQLLVLTVVFTLTTAGSGLYFLSERIIPSSLSDFTSTHHRLELAFIVLWLVSLLSATTFTAYSLSAIWVAGGTDIEDIESGGPFDVKESISGTNYENSPIIWQKPQIMSSFADLGTPLDIPVVPTDMPQLSPRLSWPSTVVSAQRTPSFTSLQSALDIRNDALETANPGLSQSENNLSSTQNSPKKKLLRQLTLPSTFSSNLSLSPKHKNNDNQSPKIPKSPMKLNLKSSFSLKREPSRTVRKHASSVSSNLTGSHHTARSGAFPPIPGASIRNGSGSYVIHSPGIHSPGTTQSLETFPHPIGFMGLEHEMPKSFVIVPNESCGESRSVSGSSQVTGHIFPASEYNRKINAAGFQKDEPRPVRLETCRETFSQYDLERAIKVRHHS